MHACSSTRYLFSLSPYRPPDAPCLPVINALTDGTTVILRSCTGMLREGKYAAYYEKACREAEKAKATGLRPLEFTHVMIDEAGQVSTLLAYARELLVFLSHLSLASPPYGLLLLCWALSLCAHRR
jgi:hypothetical protein